MRTKTPVFGTGACRVLLTDRWTHNWEPDNASVWWTKLNTKQFHGVLNKYSLWRKSADDFLRFIVMKPIRKISAEAKDLQTCFVGPARERQPVKTKGGLAFQIFLRSQQTKQNINPTLLLSLLLPDSGSVTHSVAKLGLTLLSLSRYPHVFLDHIPLERKHLDHSTITGRTMLNS